ncbi:MAG: WD40 repeat domain-containing protein [Verrucomicrobia bacterium]|nr:WD40 repeat domain-containing protein [Verrucomicrobiota bacterium]
MRTFVEDHLLTKSGFRDNLSLESALDFPGVTRPLIDTLVNRRLLRIEDRLGVERVELTHDVLAEVIRASRDTHHQKLEVAQARERERITRRRMWLARTIAAALLVGLTGVSWIAWRAVHAEREQTRLRADADVARARETKLRVEAEAQERAAQRIAYASDMNAVQSALAIDNLGRARDLLNRHRPAPGEVDLRGWEWRYLWQFCQSDATTILKPANDNSALSVAASADATWVAVGSRAGDVRIYNRQTKEEIRVPAGDRSVRVAFSPRAPLLAIATGDRSVRRTAVVAGDALPTNRVLFWDANTRQVIRELEIPGVANGLLFSDDGQTLVISSGRSTNNISRDVTEVSVWRVLDGSKVAAWTAGLTSVQVAYSWFAATRDASAAAVVTALNTVAVIDLKTGRERWNTVATDDTLLCMAFSPDGRILATGAGYVDSTIRLWDAATGKPLGRLEGQRGFTTSIAFLADGKRLVSGSGDQTLRLWDLGSRTPIRTFRGHKTEVHALALAPDQRTLVSGCKDGSAMVWDLEAERGASSSGSLAKGRVAWEFADAGASLITLGADGRVARWRGRTFQEESKLLEIGAVQIGSVLAARSGLRAVMDAKRPLLAAVTEAGKLQVWDWERRALVSEWNENIEERIPIPRRFSNDGTKLFVSVVRGNDLLLEEWDILIGRQTRSFNLGALMQARTSWITSADGMQQVIVASGDLDSVRVDLAPGRVTPFKLNTPQVAQSALSPDARLLAVPSDVGFVRVFETANYREIAKLTGFMFGAHASDFSPDQQRLAIGSTALETVTLWDANNYERLVSLASRGQASLLRFSPDGNVIAGQTVTGTNAGTLHFWRAPSWAEIEQAEAPEAAKAAERAATAGTPRN